MKSIFNKQLHGRFGNLTPALFDQLRILYLGGDISGSICFLHVTNFGVDEWTG